MWSLETLRIKNIGSHKETTYPFALKVPRLIKGENLDDSEQDSNGSGKSIPLECIRVALVGDLFRKESVSDLVRDNEEVGEVNLILNNKHHNLKLEIQRIIQATKSPKQKVNLKLNGEPLVLSSVDEYNSRILEYLDISKEDLINYYLIHKDTFKSFFHNTDLPKRNIISRFAGSDKLNGVEEVIKEDISKLSEKRNELNQEVLKLESRKEVYLEELDKLKDLNFKEEQEKKKINYKNNLLSIKDTILNKEKSIESNLVSINIKVKEEGSLEEKIFNLEKTISDLSLNKSEFEIKLSEIEKSKIEINDLIENIEDFKSETKEEKSKIENKKEILKNKLHGVIQCSKCSHEFLISEPDFNIIEGRKTLESFNLNIKELEETLNGADVDFQKANLELTKVKESIKKIDEDFSKIKSNIESKKSELLQVKNKKESFNSEIKFLNEENDRIRESIKGYKEDIKEIEESIVKIDSEKNPYIEKEKDLSKEVEVIEEVILNKNKEIQSLEFQIKEIEEWIYIFYQFKISLSNEAIKSIEVYTNKVLKDMKSDLSLNIEGFKLLADNKTIREEIVEWILRDGSIVGKFHRFSGGEKARLVVANIVALQRLINQSSKYGGLDYINMDEILESLDASGVKGIFRALKELNQTIDLITHTSHHLKEIEVLTVRKENGESKILLNEN